MSAWPETVIDDGDGKVSVEHVNMILAFAQSICAEEGRCVPCLLFAAVGAACKANDIDEMDAHDALDRAIEAMADCEVTQEHLI